MVSAFLAAGLLALGQVQPAAKDPNAVRYFEVPLKGEVGKEITAPGVRDAIKAAAAARASCVVFVIETPGGRVADAEAIANVMDQERGKGGGLKYYAVVKKAISAAVWPLSRMDGIFFAPGSAAGAAVAFSVSASTGHAEVDAKMNAALTARVAAAAETHGQPGCVYRAMMLQEASLVRWKKEDGSYALAEAAPAGMKSVENLDGPRSVLAWTAQQAAESGFGKMMKSGDVSSLGELVYAAGWVSAGSGASQMARSQREIERLEKDVEKKEAEIKSSREKVVDIARAIVSGVSSAQGADPRSTQVFYREGGSLTPDSQVKWRQQSDRAIDGWVAVLEMIEDLKSAEKRAASSVESYNKACVKLLAARLLEAKHEPVKLEPVKHNLDLVSIWREASDTLARVRSERIKSRL